MFVEFCVDVIIIFGHILLLAGLLGKLLLCVCECTCAGYECCSNFGPLSFLQTDIVLPVHGRNKPIALGQVGLRCMHCKNLPSIDRTNHAIAYPSFISGIYNAVQQMFRQHFEYCERIPEDVRRRVETLKETTSNRGGRKQYWIDSAKRVGLVDTPWGVHFGHDPTGPLPPLSEVRSASANNAGHDSVVDDEDEFGIQQIGSTDTGSPSKGEGGAPSSYTGQSGADAQEPEPYPLVESEDRSLISDYLYLALEQMQPCNLMDADRVGCYKGRSLGFPGLACKHCVGQAGCGRYFPATEASLSQTTTSQTIVNHVRNCRRCPIEIREQLELMKRAKAGPDYKKVSSLFVFCSGVHFCWQRHYLIASFFLTIE